MRPALSLPGSGRGDEEVGPPSIGGPFCESARNTTTTGCRPLPQATRSPRQRGTKRLTAGATGRAAQVLGRGAARRRDLRRRDPTASGLVSAAPLPLRDRLRPLREAEAAAVSPALLVSSLGLVQRPAEHVPPEPGQAGVCGWRAASWLDQRGRCCLRQRPLHMCQ